VLWSTEKENFCAAPAGWQTYQQFLQSVYFDCWLPLSTD